MADVVKKSSVIQVSLQHRDPEVAVRGLGHLVGFAQVVDGELARIYVVPSRQREGVGSRLLAAFPRMPMRVTVERDNTRGRAFYEKHGFVFEDNEVVSVFGHDVPVARYARRDRATVPMGRPRARRRNVGKNSWQ